MSGDREVTYAIDFCDATRRRGQLRKTSDAEAANSSIPRIARLMALAIRFEGLVREEKMRNYAEMAQLGRVTRARMSQIMKLAHLAPDIQEQLLFLPEIKGLNERNLRSVVRRVDWSEQRRLFQKITERLNGPGIRSATREI